MSRGFTVKPEAEIDLLEHFVYIGQDNLPAAKRLMAAAREAFEKLAEAPGMGRLREFSDPRLNQVRSWPIRGFENYLIFYVPTAEGIDVLRLLHGARDIERAFGQK